MWRSVAVAGVLVTLLWQPATAQENRGAQPFGGETPPRQAVDSPRTDASAGGTESAASPAGGGALAGSSDEKESERSPRSWLLLPHVFYTPETGLAGGAVVGYYPGGGLTARPSSALTSLTLTAHRQMIVEVMPDLYLDRGRLWLSGKLRAMEYPDLFYGIGQATTAEMEEDFTSRSLHLELQAQREVARGSWLGLRGRLQLEDLVEVEEGRVLATGGVVGADGGTAIGLGVVATRDTRDRAIAPRSGVLAEARWTGFTPLLGSDYEFGLLSLDGRAYAPLGAGVLALRAHAEAAQGEAPFTMLPRLGGPRLLRGYREGRFRDDLVGVLEAEYRFPIAWRFGAVVFGGVGDVASVLTDLSSPADLERAFGAGLRFRFNPAGVNIRLDWAHGREEGGLYIGLGEAF